MAATRFPFRRIAPLIPLGLALAFLIPALAQDAARAPAKNNPAEAPAKAADVPRVEAPTSFLRVLEKLGDESMDTAIASYANDAGVQVHLVGAVHIADSLYYEKLNKLFDTYEVLLYELVGSADRLTGKKKAGKNGDEVDENEEKPAGISFLGFMQKSAGRYLELEHQLHSIDYTKNHFIHADMTLEEFEKARDKRKESFLTFIIKSIEANLKAQSVGKGAEDVSIFEIIRAFAAEDSALRFKRIIAKQFKTAEFTTQQMEKDGGTTIITDRNKVAFSVLKKSIAAGKKNIGIFYGAAHMQDLEVRLLKLGFRRTGLKWFTAWDMRPKKVEGKEKAGEKKQRD